MKKIKFSSDFLMVFGILYICGIILQAVILPGLKKESNVAAVATTTTSSYSISQSTIDPNAFNFNYKFSSTPSFKDGASFDIPIQPFDKSAALKTLSSSLGYRFNFSKVKDAWGYPLRENAYMKIGKLIPGKSYVTVTKQKGGGGILKSDNDPNTPGLVNCRANTNITGYFKAYFEEVALDLNVGYDDPVFGQARRDRACQVLQDIATLIKLDQTTVTPDIIFVQNPGGLPPGALAGASSYFGYESGPQDNGSLHEHIINHVDPTPEPGHFDAFVITNFNGINWDVDSNLNPSTYSFYTVLYHEIMHALGFRGLLPATITSTNNSHDHDTFDYFTYKNSSLTNRFINAITEFLLVPTGAPSPWFITNEVVYRGIKNIPGSLPDGIRPVYSPSSWEQGSSLSHFDMNRSGGQVYVMHPSLPTNTVRPIHNDEKEVLCHEGYAVIGITGCENFTPAAFNDASTFNVGVPICVNPLSNDMSFDGGELTIGALAQTIFQAGDNLVYYTGENCTGTSSDTFAFGYKSIQFTSNSVASNRILTYKTIELSTGRISFPATIRLETCNSQPGDYICNGSFEQGIAATDIINSPNSMACGQSQVASWCSSTPTADLFIRGGISGGLPAGIPTNFFSTWAPNDQVDTHNGTPNDRYVGFYNQHVNLSYEGIQTELKQPLTTGSSYTLSFYNYPTHYGNNNTTPPYVDVYLSDHPYDGNLSTGVQYLGQVTSLIYGWTYIQIPFIANSAYTHLFINGSHDTLGDYYNYVDDVALTVGGAGPGINTIGGKLYHDQNGNGVQDVGEPGLDGVDIALFHDGENTPFLTATTQNIPNLGKYNFANLPNGTYNVAILDENIYPSISDPVANSYVSGYSYAHHVVVSGGQNSPANNFGVHLIGEQVTQNSNIHVKKSLTDATLSNTDRYITFHIEVSNGGPTTATNVNISDHVLAPFTFYSYVSTPPSSYDPGNGIWHIPSLAVGETFNLDITMWVPTSACGTKTNTAQLQSLDQIDSYTADNTGSASIKLRSCLGVAPGMRK